jgi:hypothetical protein
MNVQHFLATRYYPAPLYYSRPETERSLEGMPSKAPVAKVPTEDSGTKITNGSRYDAAYAQIIRNAFIYDSKWHYPGSSRSPVRNLKELRKQWQDI